MFYIRHVTAPSVYAQKEFIGFEIQITNSAGLYLRAGPYDLHVTLHQNGEKQPMYIFWTEAAKTCWNMETIYLLFQVVLDPKQEKGKVEIEIHASYQHKPVGFEDMDTTLFLPQSWRNEAEFYGGTIVPLRVELVDGQPRDASIRRLQFPLFQSKDDTVAAERPLLEIEELPNRRSHSTVDCGFVFASWLAMLMNKDDLLKLVHEEALLDIGYTIGEAFPVIPSISLQLLEIGSREGTLGIALAILLCRMQINTPKRPMLRPTVLLTDNSRETEATVRSNIERYHRNNTELLSHGGFGPVADLHYESLDWERGAGVDTTGKMFVTRKPWTHIIVNACGRWDKYETLIDALSTIYATTRAAGGFLIPRVILVMDREPPKTGVLQKRGWLAKTTRRIPMPNLTDYTSQQLFWITLMKLPKFVEAGEIKVAEKNGGGYSGERAENQGDETDVRKEPEMKNVEENQRQCKAQSDDESDSPHSSNKRDSNEWEGSPSKRPCYPPTGWLFE